MTFEKFYIHWYSRLKYFAIEYILSEEEAEDIIQQVFLELYEKYDVMSQQANLVTYVYTTVKNRCIDYLRHQRTKHESASRMQEEYFLTLQMKLDSLEIFEDSFFSDEHIEELLNKALHTLPEKCRIIFIKHRMEGKKHKEIAEELGISTKTIESQLTIAYKKLRIELKDYLPLLLIILYLIKKSICV